MMCALPDSELYNLEESEKWLLTLLKNPSYEPLEADNQLLERVRSMRTKGNFAVGAVIKTKLLDLFFKLIIVFVAMAVYYAYLRMNSKK